jgi:hypothetical protein
MQAHLGQRFDEQLQEKLAENFEQKLNHGCEFIDVCPIHDKPQPERCVVLPLIFSARELSPR